MVNTRALTGFLVRLSIGAIFAYFGIQALVDPLTAMSYLPAYVESFLANTTFITIWAVLELLVAIALIFGIYVRYAAFAAAALLIPIIVALGVNEVMYRDIVIFFAALHLAHEPAHMWSLKQ